MKHFSSLLAAALTSTLVACASPVVDEPATCATTACDANATCSEATGEAACTCNAGFSGDGVTCADVDECAAGNACRADNACVNAGGGFDCLPTSCAGVLANDANANDGEYTLYVNGDPAKSWQAFCVGMQTGAPAEYLTLVNVLGDSNFSSYAAGGASPGTDVKTNYIRLRLDPATLKVDIADQRFSVSTGSLSHSGAGPVTSMPYGVAMNCASLAPGRANIDLRGTPFGVGDTFVPGGNADTSQTNTSIDPSKQFVDLIGGGGCGWNASSGTSFNPFNTAPGTLQLAYVE